jgi:hypothetical protein
MPSYHNAPAGTFLFEAKEERMWNRHTLNINKAIMGLPTLQFFFSSSDVIATTFFDHTIIIRRQTVEYCRKRFA